MQGPQEVLWRTWRGLPEEGAPQAKWTVRRQRLSRAGKRAPGIPR